MKATDGVEVSCLNQHNDVLIVPEPVLEDEDEDPEEDEFEEKEEHQEEEDDMEVDIEEDENEPELTYPYEEVDPLNPLPPVSNVEARTRPPMEKLVEKLENVEEKAECKKLKKELKEARLSNTFLRMQNERVERDLYWTRVQAHEFYQEMIRRGFVFEERPNEAIDILIEDEKSPLSESQRSPRDV
ncbi:hypothetical protein Tco_0320396 [Tanacetum coccineum]